MKMLKNPLPRMAFYFESFRHTEHTGWRTKILGNVPPEAMVGILKFVVVVVSALVNET